MNFYSSRHVGRGQLEQLRNLTGDFTRKYPQIAHQIAQFYGSGTLRSMEHFPLKLPPICEEVTICSGDPIPDRYKNAIIAEHDRLYPNVDLLFSVSRKEGFFSFYDRTQEGFYHITNFKAIVLDPVGPAKGSGYILLLATKTNPNSPAYLLSVDGYNDTKEQWMRECAQIIANTIDLPFEEYSLGGDA